MKTIHARVRVVACKTMATASGVVVDADSKNNPCVVVQQFGEERGQGLVAVKSFSKAQTIFREKVIVYSYCRFRPPFSSILIPPPNLKVLPN